MRNDSYTSRAEKWTKREMQLNRLHEEIITRRESLLRSTGNSLHQHQHQSSPSLSQEEVVRRNSQLLQDVQSTRRRLSEEARQPPDTRFLTLQSNYKSMIRSLQPMWERSLSESAVRDWGGSRQ